MKVAFFSTKRYDRETFGEYSKDFPHKIKYLETRLTEETASLAKGYQAVCVFVNDIVSREVIKEISEYGISLIALRCAGFNNVDLQAAEEFNVKVVRVPAYSPYSVAEHTVGLLLTLNRKFHKAYYRVREGNFALDGLMGFDLSGKTVGIIGTGKIGAIVAKIMHGFGCKILAFDSWKNPDCLSLGVDYVEFDYLIKNADILTLHCPLIPETHHLINGKTIRMMKPGVVLINTSRGGLVDTEAVIMGLKNKRIGALGLDVYEEEGDLFFEDLSEEIIQDDIFSRLLTFHNVVITGHQAFFTNEALGKIAQTTLNNISAIFSGKECSNHVEASFFKK
jgi:D-lactate dehydrogenase